MQQYLIVLQEIQGASSISLTKKIIQRTFWLFFNHIIGGLFSTDECSLSK